MQNHLARVVCLLFNISDTLGK